MANTAAILSNFGRNKKVIQRHTISPQPRTRWWRQVHKGWKGRNMSHGVREMHLRAQAEDPLGSLCPAFGWDTEEILD